MDYQITTLQELLDCLPSCSGKDYINIAKKMKLDITDFEPYLFWSADKYTRNCIVRTEAYELILLCWEEGQETPIHCHGGEECWVYVLQGTLEEYRYKGELANKDLYVDHIMALKKGGLSYMNDDMGFHSLHNIHPGRAMSLHLYMNPIDECRALNESTLQFELRDLKYNSYEGELLVPATT